MKLSDYVRVEFIEAARTMLSEDALQVGPTDDPEEWGIKVMLSGSHGSVERGSVFEACYWFYLYALGKVLRDGAKVIRPTPEQMRVLGDVELNISLDEYAQPYPGVGVIVPGSLYDGEDCLAVCAWRPGKGVTISCQGKSFHLMTIGPHFKGVIERAFDQEEEENDDGVAFERIFRAVLNLNLFAVEKGVKVLGLDAGAERRRRRSHRDDRMARLAARDAHEVVVQDLDLILRPPTNSAGMPGEPTGRRVRLHRRRGHWKMQPCGPGRKQRKRIYVHSYMVHADDDPECEVQSILS